MIPLYKPYMPNALPELDNILHSEHLRVVNGVKYLRTNCRNLLDVEICCQ